MSRSKRVLDVLIVGGGLSGLLIADHLQRRGMTGMILEAGPAPSGARFTRSLPPRAADFQTAVRPLLPIDDEQWKFRSEGLPYEWVRVRAAGGRSLLWGGWCTRPTEQNWRDAAALCTPWPVSFRALEPYWKQVERRLHVRTGRVSRFFEPIARELGLSLAPKRGAPFASKQRAITGLDLARPFPVVEHTVATGIDIESGRVQGVETLHTLTGERRSLAARHVVLCASPIETTRLLLASGITGAGRPVGSGLVDHVVASCLAILPQRTTAEANLFHRAVLIPRFVNAGKMGRTNRRDYSSGFITEARGPVPLRQLGDEAIASLGVDAADADKLSYCSVHAIGEVAPHPQQRVTLDTETHDSLGRPIPVVHLAWHEEQGRMIGDMEETVAAIADSLAPPGSRIIRLRDPHIAGGIAHEAGTAAMGMSADHGVTDPWGRVFGVEGLAIGDASVMPTALDRHPSLTLFALALRTAERLATSPAP